MDKCAWCGQLVCEDKTSGLLICGFSAEQCMESGDGRHHTEVPEQDRKGFIISMARIAAEEPEEFHDGDDLVTRTMHYTASARPRVTRAEIEETIGGTVLDHSECVPADEHNPRGHTHEGKTGWWLWPDEVGKGLYDDSPTGA